MKFQYDLMIAGISLRWCSEIPLKMDERYSAFMQDGDKDPDIILEIHIDDEDYDTGTADVLFERIGFQIKEDEKYRYRLFFYDCTAPEKFMTLIRKKEEMTAGSEVWHLYLPSGAIELFQQTESRTYYMAFEEMLYHRSRILLHASYVETKEGAILFTGPSGAGKSTQADLWNRYGDGEVMNGDRTILYEDGDTIMAAGSPCAGSSGIYRNYQSPVRAIVVLSKGEENHIEKIRGRDSLIPLIRESNFQFMEEKMKANQMELLISVVERIPIYRYECKRDRSAVEFLQKTLANEI